jgi:hypothetical protein
VARGAPVAGVPDLGGAVVTDGGQQSAVSRERQADGVAAVALKGGSRVASSGVPDFGGAVDGTSGELGAVE